MKQFAILSLVLPHIINAAVFTSAFSAGNSYLFCGSRILYGLALRGQGPRFLTYCTKNGLPLTAVLVTVCVRSFAGHFMGVDVRILSVLLLIVIFHDC